MISIHLHLRLMFHTQTPLPLSLPSSSSLSFPHLTRSSIWNQWNVSFQWLKSYPKHKMYTLWNSFIHFFISIKYPDLFQSDLNHFLFYSRIALNSNMKALLLLANWRIKPLLELFISDLQGYECFWKSHTCDLDEWYCCLLWWNIHFPPLLYFAWVELLSSSFLV